MIELYVEEEKKSYQTGATLKVIGIGGAGSNAVNSMVQSGEMKSVEYLIANTDAQALQASPVERKIQLGTKITKGLGAGSNPDIGRRAAEEDIETIAQHIENSDILFLTAGLGGGTGSGGLPVIAQVAKEMGILTVAIVTKPFIFEGRRRLKIAEEAVRVMKSTVDTLIVVPNQRLLEIVDAKISMLDAFALSNDILKQAIKGISDIIMKSGHINVDFADVKTIMKDMGMALMGTGRAHGEGRARQAALNAISSPLLENVSIKGAQGVLINITGNVDLGLYEINEAASLVYEMVSEEANIILGSVIDTEIGNEVMVTVIATGFEQEEACAHETKNTALGSKKTSMHQPEQKNNYFSTKKETESSAKKYHENRHEEAESKESVMQVIPSKSDTITELDDLDTPTFLRKKIEMQQQQDEYEKSIAQEGL
jgi:cell division protein FtsZ